MLSVPGLKIVCPSNPAEAYGMLKAAIRDDNPVLVLEHKALLSMKGPVPVGSDAAAMPSGPLIVRPGKDVTIVASLAMVGKALAAADLLQAEGIAAEVIDIRVLRPLDVGPISESVRRTNILVTVEEQSPTGGWSSDVVADVVSQAFDYLDAPPARITLPDHPLPYSPNLEDALIPSPERIAATREVAAQGDWPEFVGPVGWAKRSVPTRRLHRRADAWARFALPTLQIPSWWCRSRRVMSVARPSTRSYSWTRTSRERLPSATTKARSAAS